MKAFFHEHINFLKITINGEKIVHVVRGGK